MPRIAAVLAALVAVAAAPPAGADQWVLQDVKVLEVTNGEVLQDRSVLIRDNRVAAVLTDSESPPEAATVIDGEGGWLIPGLAEMHAHIPPHTGGEQRVKDVLHLFLANGVTTARGMLGEPWHLELRDMLASGVWEGPRLVTSGPSFSGRTINSPDEARERVREQAAAGYDFLKIHPGLSREEFHALAETAREIGIPFAGHVSHETGLEAALDAGQATIDHLDGFAQEMVPPEADLHGQAPRFFGLNLAAAMDPSRADALARATADAGVWVVPTQSLFETTVGRQSVETLQERPGMNMLSDELRQRWREAVENIREQSPPEARDNFLTARRTLIRALQTSGAGILLGSDAPQIMNVPGYSVHQELAWMVVAGLTPLEALQSATIRVAEFFGHEDQGAVRPGHMADLVLLNANPLENITNSARIVGVVRNGRWYDRDRLDAMLEDIATRGL